MIINIKSNRSIEEIENILSYQVSEKYPKKYREYGLGINWVSNRVNFLCLFYEDGTKDRWGYQTRAKSFFYGRVINVKDKPRIVGIAGVNIFVVISMLIVLGIFIIEIDDFDIETLFGAVFILFIFSMFYLHIGKGNKEIKNYLISKFR